MELGENMMLLRKKKKLSQSALGKAIGTSGDVIGRYERGEITPSIEVVSKIADVLDTSVDYLIGKTNMLLDDDAIKRLEKISSLPDSNKSFILNIIDMALRDFNAKQTYAS